MMSEILCPPSYTVDLKYSSQLQVSLEDAHTGIMKKTDLQKSVKKINRLTNTIEFHKLDISKLKKEDYTKINTLIKVYYVEIKELRK